MANNEWEELGRQIKRLTEEVHPKLIEYLRIIEKIVTDDQVKHFEECDHLISKFLEFKNGLTEHLELEDYVIFPKILRAIRFNRADLRDIQERLYASELTEWIAYHNVVREELDSLITINDIIEECNLHEMTGNYFREFESFLREHAEFEDATLFPAALKLAIDDLE
jgi:hemerythrin-like domain-containing protein